MKNNLIKVALFICYCTPFVFLAMNEDATVGSLWFYLFMIIGFSILCYCCIKTKNYFIVILGNIASFISSCIFALNFYTDKWEYYFKPFLPNQLIIFEMVIAFLIQISFVRHFKRKSEEKDVWYKSFIWHINTILIKPKRKVGCKNKT